MAAPTAEEFLAQTDPDEPDEEQQPRDPQTPPTADLALGSIATSLRMLADIVVRRDREEELEDTREQRIHELELDLQATRSQLDEVLALCKKSTSKLANSVREVLETETVTAPPEPEA